MTTKLSLSPKDIIGSQKEGENLVLILKNGDTIVVDGFFVVPDNNKEKKKVLLLEDTSAGMSKTYEAQYNNINFNGINFKTYNPSEIIAEAADETGTSYSWIVPLVGVGALGTLGAVALTKNSHSGKDNNDKKANPEPAAPDEVKAAADRAQASAEAAKAAADPFPLMDLAPEHRQKNLLKNLSKLQKMPQKQRLMQSKRLKTLLRKLSLI